ncbi:hypothetical protein BH23GEM11_BH23GEM11_15010 [soil metagenome]
MGAMVVAGWADENRAAPERKMTEGPECDKEACSANGAACRTLPAGVNVPVPSEPPGLAPRARTREGKKTGNAKSPRLAPEALP